MKLLREFKPALMFLGKFLGLYFIGNLLYGIYVESYSARADGVTKAVTAQTSWVLNQLAYNTSYEQIPGSSKIALLEGGDIVLNVFEGCNGVNVFIVFVSFLFAFGGPTKAFCLFLPLGILAIHLFNLLRIGLLFSLALNNSHQFYYYHKYFFTATLYVVVVALWAVWVIKLHENPEVKSA